MHGLSDDTCLQCFDAVSRVIEKDIEPVNNLSNDLPETH